MTAMNEKNREDRLLDRVFELVFEEEPKQYRGSLFPQLWGGDRLL